MDIALERIANMHDNKLNLSNLGLTELPPIPDTVVELWCNNNQLTELQPLPPTLTYLNCRDNALTSLPPLPPTLIYLDCYNNQLTELQPLPPTLTYLNCLNNPIQYPPLESLGYFHIRYIIDWMKEHPPTFVKSAYKV